MNLLKSASLLLLAAVLAIPIGLWQVIEQSPSALAEAPIINSISPSSGSIDGGDTVTISGSGFSPDAIDKVVTSGSHSCLLVSAQAYCWGSNSNGQLGDGTTENRLAPTAVNNSGVLAGRTVTDIAVGNNHSCAVADGQAYCWGTNSSKNLGDGTNTSSSVPVAVSTSGALSGKTVTSIASKGSLTCVIANSQAYCWGSNFYGGVGNGTTSADSVPVAVSTAGVLSSKTLTNLAVGHTHACAIAGGQVYCWGGNSDGQLGDNSTTNRTTPVAVNTSGALSGKTVTKIATGSNNSCAIANGQAYCWGNNFNGQLGRGNSGTGTNSSVPLAVSTAGVLSNKTVTDIGIGMHACAVADNQAYCWGVGYYGNLGNGTFGTGTDSPLPVAVDTSGVLNGKTVSQVTAEGVASCVIADGSISCWGSNPIGGGYDSGHLPIDIDKSTTQPEPQVSFGGVSATAVAVVNDNTITAETPAGLAGPVDVTVTKGDNPPFTMSNSFTYTGPPPTLSSVTPNTGVGGDNVTITGADFAGQSAEFDLISTGSTASHSCGVSGQELYCWGDNFYGQLGNNSTTNQSSPVIVDNSSVLSGKSITAVATGYSHSCALDSNGAAYCWGSNEEGQLGDGTQTSSSTPVAVNLGGALSGKTLTKITAGADFTCVLDSSGAAYCWGKNNFGQLGNGSQGASSPVAIKVDDSGVIAGKTLTDITSGVYSSCAIDSTGQAYCWGVNDDGQLGDGTNNSSDSPVTVDTSARFTSLDSGFVHACGLTTEASVLCWGDNTEGQLGDGSTTDSFTPVAIDTSGELSGQTITAAQAGGSNSCALNSDGQAYCWGDNSEGQLGNHTTAESLTATAVSTSGILAGKSIAGLALKASHTCALDSNGRAYCWGSGDSGQLGNDSFSDNSAAVMVNTDSIAAHPSVLFGTVPAANIVMVNSTTLTATVPSQAAGVVDVTVENPDGQSASLTNGFTYQTVLSPPEAPTSLMATPASGQVDLAWTAPSNDGGSPITDYQVEYSEDGVAWQEFSHPPSTATSLAITDLNPGISYQFRVSAINSQGASQPSNIASAGILYISLGAPTNVGIEVTPSGASTVSSSNSLINITTNNPDGYDLTLESSSSNRNLVNGDSNVTPASGDLLTPASLGINTWGYRVDGAGGFSGTTVTESNVSSSGYSWAGVPAMGNPDLIKSADQAITDDQTTVWYAMSIDNNHPSGTYTNTVLYTAVAG